ncbi:MAG TPA: methyltransferase domain-containing protein, partial [Candidatus Omnitrophota bacterium]|nr:methyltransferase domain-containing protein [Candidatus Omnitrophota bacterium]
MEIKDFDKEYCQKGPYHHSQSGFKKMWLDRNYSMLTDGFKGKVLDIACGDGRIADFLKKGAVIDGFDVSAKAVEFARSKHLYRDLWISDIRDKTAYDKDKYDHYVCSLSLQYLTDDELENHFRSMSSLIASGA